MEWKACKNWDYSKWHESKERTKEQAAKTVQIVETFVQIVETFVSTNICCAWKIQYSVCVATSIKISRERSATKRMDCVEYRLKEWCVICAIWKNCSNKNIRAKYKNNTARYGVRSSGRQPTGRQYFELGLGSALDLEIVIFVAQLFVALLAPDDWRAEDNSE